VITLVITISIACPPARVRAYVRDARNLPADAAFEADAQQVVTDLAKLKAVLEAPGS